MKILNGGKKDFYDYLSGIYGIDNDVVYNRVNGHVFRPMYDGDIYFCKEQLYNDKPKKEVRGYNWVDGKRFYTPKLEGLKLHFIIEVGFVHYLFMVERYIDECGKIQLDPQLLDKQRVSEKKSTSPVSLIPVEMYSFYSLYRDTPKVWKYNTDNEIPNPIFNGTWLPSLVSADEIYNEIYSYLIAIKEPNIVDTRNDVQKLESKGFDKKTSFRNPVINANSKKKK